MMRKAYAKTDIVELRTDRIHNADLKMLIGAKQGKIIVTNRCRKEGGEFAGTEEERIDLLKEAVQLGAEYIDVEMETDQTLRKDLEETIRTFGGRTQMILSWHDYRKTPSDRALRTRMEKGIRGGGNIVKMVPHALSFEDNLRVLNLIMHAKKNDQPVIAFCMGDKGRLSRIMSPYLGSLMTYAVLEKAGITAPGQMTIDEMQRVFKLFEG